MSAERISVEVMRSGGFGGVRRSGRVDTAELDDERAATLRGLLAQAGILNRRTAVSRPSRGGADQFQYEVTLVRGNDLHSVVVYEQDMSDSDRDLVRWVLNEGRRRG